MQACGDLQGLSRNQDTGPNVRVMLLLPTQVTVQDKTRASGLGELVCE